MKNQKVFVMGHKNPDTDSICSAIAYADIKNRTTQTKRYIPRRAGQINEETQYVLNRFGVQPPAYLGNIGTQVKDGYPSKTGCRPYHVPEKCLGYDAE